MYVTGPNAAFALDALTGREIWVYSRPRTRELVGDAALGTNRGVAVLGDKVFMVTDTLYWSTGNPFPDSDDRDRPGDNLYTNCILALNPGTGKLKWYYQFTPHDVHDWDATEPAVLVDTRYRGQDRKLLLHADRNR